MNFIEYMKRKYLQEKESLEPFWITTKKGRHVLINPDGEIVSGLGGAFNGKKITEIGGIRERINSHLKEYKQGTKTAHKELDIKALDISEKAMQAMISYTGASAKVINNALRKGELDSPTNATNREKVHLLDEIMEKSVVKTPFVAYRGLNIRTESTRQKYDDLKVGDSFQDEGFVSTSTNQKKADTFGSGQRIMILVPKGANAVSPRSVSRYKTEDEILLDRGGTFKVIDIEEKTDDFGKPQKTFKVVLIPRGK